MKTSILLASLCASGLAVPSKANLVVEPSYEQILDRSDLVVIGTVASSDGDGNEFGSTATISVRLTLKGEGSNTLVVSTYSRISELNPRCCEVGATYLMFLRRLPSGELVSVLGAYGMRRIGGPPTRIEVLPATQAEPQRRD
jgi:hypothetical protein